MDNTSGIKPLGHAVLVRYYEPERKDSLIVVPNHVKQKANMVEQRAQVIAVGPEAWATESQPRAVPGDYVVIAYAAGYQTYGPADGRLYRLINDRDIFAGLTHLGAAVPPVEEMVGA